MNINWYPGHMKKTKESIKKNLQLVDIIYELLDARIPISSENPDIDNIVGDKPRIVILNKSDLSSHEGNIKWQQYYQNKGIASVLVDSLNNKGLSELIDISNKLMKEKKLKLEKKGIKNRPIRAMIVGIPNVGKSTLINSLSGRRGAKTGNRPGVTKANQWIKLKGNLELLDTPGILWPKFEDESVGLNLAFTGAIKDELLDIESLAFKLVERLVDTYPELLENRYNITVCGKTIYEIVENIAQNRGCISKGQEIDFTKVSNIIIDDFRKGRIGRITLELP
ncbi:MAG: ribosome biogenesis GTPase YlqF [Sporanaerobacter sp.]|jgi:ribosome biogenesis GTPase A|uniref:ribosome biogenesis GTPase YlqF n=1 Tax=Sporanaerobacter sp. TaxID=2010183 RepID=UPI003A0FDCED